MRLVSAFSSAAALTAVSVPVLAADAIQFTNACRPGTRVVVAAVGDLLFHSALQKQALTTKGSYADFWQPVQHILDQSDLTYGNLEGAVAAGVGIGGRSVADPGRRLDGRVYSAKVNEFLFNYHPSLIADLKDTGFDVVSTANNHSGDRGPLGVDGTIDALETEALAFTGTRRRDESNTRPWSTVVESKDVRIAFLACTYGTNGGVDRNGQILNCYRDKAQVMGEIQWLTEDPGVDAVILTPHWGVENSHTPLSSDRAYARAAIEAGASAVIGAHPHVLQPWEKITAKDGREGLVIYSTGNFISNQPWTPNRSGVVALLEFTKGRDGKTALTATGFVPTWVARDGWHHRVTEMRSGNRESAGALSATLRRLPSANRVSGDAARSLPRACVLTSETATAAPAQP